MKPRARRRKAPQKAPQEAPQKAPSLGTLQRWVSVVIQHEKSSAPAIRSSRASALIAPRRALEGEIVKPSRTLAPAARIDAYNGGYLLRLVEVLQADYKGLEAVLGHEQFHRLAARYVVRHPSRHPNLIRFGKQLPEFVRTRLAHPARAFLAELARLECTMSLAFDAPESAPLRDEDYRAISASEFARVVLTPSPSLHLLELRWPTNRFLVEILEKDRVPPIPKPHRTRVAVYRKDGRVWRANLTEPAFRVLRAICAGKPLGTALAAAGPGADGSLVTEWFRDWAADGLFVGKRVLRR